MGLAPRLGLLLFISFNKAPSVEAKIYTRHVKSVKNVKNIERFFMSSYQGHQKHHVIFQGKSATFELGLILHLKHVRQKHTRQHIFQKATWKKAYSI